MDEKQFNELVEKVGKEAAERIKKELDTAKKDLVTADQLEAKLKEIPNVDVKSLKIGEKSIEDILREQGEQIATFKAASAKHEKKNGLKAIIKDNWKKIEDVFKKKSGHVVLSLKAADIMDTGSTLDSSAIFTDSEPDVMENFRVDSMVPKRYDLQYIFDIADRTTVAEVPENIIWYEEGTNDGTFAVVDEGAVKPLMDFALVKNFSEAKKAAGKIIITEELQKFRTRIMSMIRTLWNEKVLRDYADLLTVDLVAAAASYVGTTLDATIANPTDYHAIGAVAAQLESLNFNPDILIINPQDKWRMALEQDSTGAFYINVPVMSATGQLQFMGFRTITTNKVSAGTFILGEGRTWKIEEEGVQIRVGYGISSDGDGGYTSDFDNNRMRMIAELFFHDYIATNNTGSFVKADFDDMKAALLAPEV